MDLGFDVSTVSNQNSRKIDRDWCSCDTLLRDAPRVMPLLRGTLACATMMGVLLALALRLCVVSAVAPSAAPSAELHKPPAQLRELAKGPKCPTVSGALELSDPPSRIV